MGSRLISLVRADREVPHLGREAEFLKNGISESKAHTTNQSTKGCVNIAVLEYFTLNSLLEHLEFCQVNSGQKNTDV